MTSPAFELPSTPLPASHSATYNIHRIYRPSPTVMLLQPSPVLWIWTLVALAFAPLVWSVGRACSFDTALTHGLSLALVFMAAGLAIMALIFHRFGPYVRFDRDTQHISITGLQYGKGHHHPMAEIRGVQFCDAGEKENTETSWHAYQLNLVLGRHAPTRINLLECAGEAKLRAIAQAVADFLGVPLYTGSPAKSETV